MTMLSNFSLILNFLSINCSSKDRIVFWVSRFLRFAVTGRVHVTKEAWNSTP